REGHVLGELRAVLSACCKAPLAFENTRGVAPLQKAPKRAIGRGDLDGNRSSSPDNEWVILEQTCHCRAKVEFPRAADASRSLVFEVYAKWFLGKDARRAPENCC